MDFKFGGYIHRIHPNKSLLKILEKREHGHIQGHKLGEVEKECTSPSLCQKFSRWKFDKSSDKNNFAQFFEAQCRDYIFTAARML